MEVSVTKLTDVILLRRANSFTTGKESNMTLAKAYKHSHSPIRTQLFWVECTEIPLFVASQLVRSHVGVQYFQLSNCTDRGGDDFRTVCSGLATNLANDIVGEYEDGIAMGLEVLRNLPERFDRFTPTDLAFIINA